MSAQFIPPDAPIDDIQFVPTFDSQQPSGVAVINGARFRIHEVEIEENAHGATNSGHVTLSIADNPDFTVLLFRGDASSSGTNIVSGAGDYTPVYVQIYQGYPSNPTPLDISQLTQTFTGVVDQYSVTIDTESGLVTFAMRSLASVLVDNKITMLNASMTTVQFVQSVCSLYGLQCDTSNVIGTPLTLQEVLGDSLIGGSSFQSAVYGMHIWDLILKCAEFDDVDVWEDSRTGKLWYAAPSLIQRTTVQYQLGKNIEKFSGVHSPQFSKNIRVEVRTFQQRTKVSTTVRVESDGQGGATVTASSRTVTSSPVFGTPNIVSTNISSNGTTTTTSGSTTGGSFSGVGQTGATESNKERYIFYVKNISQAAANKLALAKLRQISMHEYSTTITTAVTQDTLQAVTITALIDLSGVPYTFFNDQYWPRKITTTMSPEVGWKRTIEQVNHTPPMGSV